MRKRAARQAELDALRGLRRAAAGWDQAAAREAIRGWCRDWHAMLEAEPMAARQFLRKVFVSRLVWTPRTDAAGTWYDYAVDTSYARLLTGRIGGKSGVPGGGIEPPRPEGHQILSGRVQHVREPRIGANPP
jgi:hypothetical protein